MNDPQPPRSDALPDSPPEEPMQAAPGEPLKPGSPPADAPGATDVPLSQDLVIRRIGQALLASALRQATDPKHRARIQRILV